MKTIFLYLFENTPRFRFRAHLLFLALVLAAAMVLPQEVLAGEWTETSSLATKRMLHTATRLDDGRILVTGGENYMDDGWTDSTEIYDPTSGTWIAVGPLNTGRSGHTVTLLNNGRVLVAGGYDGDAPWPGILLASSELYIEETEIWSYTSGTLNVGRSKHTATLLPDGTVMVAGGMGSTNGDILSSAELFDPSTETWSMTGSLNQARQSHTATQLPDGKVLIVGGYGGGILASAEIYDPSTGIWSVTGSLNTARQSHTAALLPDGKVLVVGGINDVILASVEIYDPATGIWTKTGSLNTARYNHAASILDDGRILIMGGRDDTYAFLFSAEIYDPESGTWNLTGSLNTSRFYHSATLLDDGRILVVGGMGSNWDQLVSAEIYEEASAVNLTMDVSPAGAGTTSPAVGTNSVTPSMPQAVSATANPGYNFVNWTTSGSEVAVADANAISTTVTLTGDATVVANFCFLQTWYPDEDDDTYGNPLGVVLVSCTQPSGYVADNTDCNDNDENIHPGALEICDGFDNNCNGSFDEEVMMTWYADADADTYGNPDISVDSCTQPEGYVADNTDCDDANASVNPGAEDIPGDDIDQDCSGADVCTGTDTDNDTVCDDVDICSDYDDRLDADGDGIADCQDHEDSDSDGFTDAEEVICGSDPADPGIRCSMGFPWLMLLLD